MAKQRLDCKGTQLKTERCSMRIKHRPFKCCAWSPVLPASLGENITKTWISSSDSFFQGLSDSLLTVMIIEFFVEVIREKLTALLAQVNSTAVRKLLSIFNQPSLSLSYKLVVTDPLSNRLYYPFPPLPASFLTCSLK